MSRIRIIIATLLLPSAVSAAELQHNFNSPAFSGIGYSSHVLTVKQLEDQAKDKNKAAAEALKAKAEADAQNTPTARFLANVEARIFSQLAKQMTDSLFGEGATCNSGSSSSPCGQIANVGGEGGNTIMWWVEAGNNGASMIHIKVTNPNDSRQNADMIIPANSFYF